MYAATGVDVKRVRPNFLGIVKRAPQRFAGGATNYGISNDSNGIIVLEIRLKIDDRLYRIFKFFDKQLSKIKF